MIMSNKEQELRRAKERYDSEVAYINRHMPNKWKVGMKVRYVVDKEWAWSKGQTATIKSFNGKPANRADEYQVFYTVPDNGYGIFWTTPSEVEWIEE